MPVGLGAIALEALTQQQRDGYVPLCPDFVVELRKVRCGGLPPSPKGTPIPPRCSTFSRERSPTDILEELQTGMQEHMDNQAVGLAD